MNENIWKSVNNENGENENGGEASAIIMANESNNRNSLWRKAISKWRK
jgi:hypothetical protein